MSDFSELPKPGTAPEGFAARRRLESVGINTNNSNGGNSIPAPQLVMHKDMPVNGGVANPAVARRPVERIRLVHSHPSEGLGFIFEFDVYSVEVSDLYVALLIASDIVFEPSTTATFQIHYGKLVYPVTFVGGIFRFAKEGINCISFLRNKVTDDKTRSS